MTDRDDLRAAVEKVLRGNGLTDKPAEYDSDIHSWRCRYPDIYGPCDCFVELANDLRALLVEPPDDTPVWCSEHMEPYCPRHTEPPSEPKGCRHIELPDTLWKRLREAEEKAEEEYRRGFNEGVRRLDNLRREQGDAAPEPPSDEAAMHIDPEPPGVTTRPFTDAEEAVSAEPTSGGEEWCHPRYGSCALLSGHEGPHHGFPANIRRAALALLSSEPPSGGEVTADELAEVIADRVVAYFKTISYLADTSDEGWADEHEIAKHGQARRSAAAILARYDVRRKP